MRALLFDVFGTCVDWRTSIMRELERFGLPPGLADEQDREELVIIAPCSNGHIAQSVNLAKHAKLPWDAILGAEIARAYKPDPRVYRESVYALGLAAR